MSQGRNKYRSRESRAVVRDLFMREWDPIGVSGVEEAQDEYDSYVAKAYVMLMDDHASAKKMAEYLWDISTSHMGLTASRELWHRCTRTAELLPELRPSFETH